MTKISKIREDFLLLALLILHSPKLIISEGIANKALSVIFSDQMVAEIGLNELCSAPLKEVSLEELELQNLVKAKLTFIIKIK